MSCAGCSSEKDNKVHGCQNNGTCESGGCNKLNSFDWLSHMSSPGNQSYDIAEVRFKNGRKDFFKIPEEVEVVTGDPVIVDVPNGHHLGHISLQGELVRLQIKKKKIDKSEVKGIYRKADEKDLAKYRTVKNRELPTMYRTREIINDLKLEMKLTDVEYQADNSKATFFYSASDRVDFRELIKVLASEFRIRVEMKQISLRQEAGRIGGIGSCGRELCCSTWLTDFKVVNTQAARYQNLSLNPGKLSGQCGRLKCCLNYELDTYMEALKDIPKIRKALVTSKGQAKLQKTDIFRKIMWFGYEGDHNWIPISTSRASEILEQNSKEIIPASLALDKLETPKEENKINSDLEAMDRKFRKKSKKSRSSKNRGNRKSRQQNHNP